MKQEFFLTLIQIFLGVLAIILPLFAGEAYFRSRSPVHIKYRAVTSGMSANKIWRIDITISRWINSNDPIFVVPKRRGNRFFACKQIKLNRDIQRVRINNNGLVEIDIRQAPQNTKIRLRCYLADDDELFFYCDNPKILVRSVWDLPLYQNLFIGGGKSYLIVAKFRLLWLFTNLAVVSIICELRLFYLFWHG